MAGMHKHKWSYTVKYAPDHFGHNSFQPPNRTVTKRWLNLDDLVRLGSKPGEKLDLTALGYDKLLGQGRVESVFNLIVPRASASAVEKIKAAGGSVETEVKAESSEKTGKDSKHPKNDSASSKAK